MKAVGNCLLLSGSMVKDLVFNILFFTPPYFFISPTRLSLDKYFVHLYPRNSSEPWTIYSNHSPFHDPSAVSSVSHLLSASSRILVRIEKENKNKNKNKIDFFLIFLSFYPLSLSPPSPSLVKFTPNNNYNNNNNNNNNNNRIEYSKDKKIEFLSNHISSFFTIIIWTGSRL